MKNSNKKIFLFCCLLIFNWSQKAFSQAIGTGSRMNEVFKRTNIAAGSTRLYDPWEVTYGPDDSLWVTESKSYKVYKISPVTGVKRMVLDISQNSTFLPSSDNSFNLQFNFAGKGNPQGGLAGLAIHPNFMDVVTPKKYVYIAYIHTFVTTITSPTNGGVIFTNNLVRFTYNTTTGLLENPVSLCDTIPGSSDHNSLRIIIAPVNGVDYLFYAAGDMGAGQFGNAYRINKAQNSLSYEGKILRFNIDPDSDPGKLNQWIPDDNPFNTTTAPIKQSAVWSTGIRNNQGFAFAKINSKEFFYGSSHGPFSDDEINVIEKGTNYGHPRVVGYSADGNYNNAKASSASSSLPLIYDEAVYAKDTIGSSYRDPIYSLYIAPKGSSGVTGTVQHMYLNNPGNSSWPSEAPSGLDVYTNSMIPGWKNSLLLASLKGGKIIRLKLNNTGDGIANNPNDTINYFRSTNRFRDIAIGKDGKTIFAVIDSSATTSGPTTGNPIISACRGCVQKYTFLGYKDDGTSSTIPTDLPIATGIINDCENVNTITIDSTNTNYWVPITDTNSNIVAEIKANGNILGNVTTAIHINAGNVRETVIGKILYLNRSITITPVMQPSSPVSLRLYLTLEEFLALKNASNSMSQQSGVNSVINLTLYKNNNNCGTGLINMPMPIATSNQAAFGNNGYVLQGYVNSFSTFYVANTTLSLLPVNTVLLNGEINNSLAKLKWQVKDNLTAKSFVIERSVNNQYYDSIAVIAGHQRNENNSYTYNDAQTASLQSLIIYYRLKIIGIHEKYKYSSIIALQQKPATATISVSPNPLINNTAITIYAAHNEKLTWQLINNAGKMVTQQCVVLHKGKNNIPINFGNLSKGTYYVKLQGATINQGVKLQVQ